MSDQEALFVFIAEMVIGSSRLGSWQMSQEHTHFNLSQLVFVLTQNKYAVQDGNIFVGGRVTVV